MLAMLAVAAKVALLIPFSAPRAEAWSGFALADLMTDLIAQEPSATWVSLKQVDAVLRRRDLGPDDANGEAAWLSRALGAGAVVTGELRHVDGRWIADARLTSEKEKARQGAEGKRAHAEGTLAQVASALVQELFDGKAKTPRAPRAPPAPMTSSTRALESLARCEEATLRIPLKPQAAAPAKLDRPAEAEADCRAALEADPKLGAAHAALGVVLALKGQTALARAEAKAASAAQPERFVPQALIALAFAARLEGDEAASRRALEQAVKARPGFLLALGYLAEDRLLENDPKGALAAWERYLARAPGHPWALAQKGHALSRLGRKQEALAVTRQAIDLDPGDPELLIELASRQLDVDDERGAEATLRQALEAQPPRPLARLRLGYLYLRQKRAAEARETLTEAVTDAWREDEAETRGLAFADLARAAALEGKLDDTVEYLQAAKAEGAPRVLPCDAPELAPLRNKPELIAVCGK